jgi:hypothetical protein
MTVTAKKQAQTLPMAKKKIVDKKRRLQQRLLPRLRR